jgi:hypothetical protein
MRSVKLPFVQRRIGIVYLGIFLAIMSFSIAAFASSVAVTTTNDAGYQGVYVNDNGYYSVTDTNYYVVEAAQADSTQPLAWANDTIAYVNTLVPGDWALSFTLTINAGGLTSHTYTISVTSTEANGTTTNLYTFQFTSPSAITAGENMTIIWDTGNTSWVSPAALTVTIA